MVAVRNYSPEDRGQLSFHKGDIIHLQPLERPERGEQPLTAPHAEMPLMGGTGAPGFTGRGGGRALPSHPVTPRVPMMSLQTTTMVVWFARR